MCVHELMHRHGVPLDQVHVSSDGSMVSVLYCGSTFLCGPLGYGGEEFARMWAGAGALWNQTDSRAHRQKRRLWEDFKANTADMDTLVLAILNAPNLLTATTHSLEEV